LIHIAAFIIAIGFHCFSFALAALLLPLLRWLPPDVVIDYTPFR